MAAIQTPGLNPSVLVAPDYQTQMLAAQRRLELAQALQEEAMKDTPGNGGSVSWTQGLARIMDAIASKRTASQGYQQMKGANSAYAAGMARLFGMPGSPETAQGAPPALSGAPTPQTAPQAPQQPPAQPSAPFVPGTPVAPGQPDPLAPQPIAPPQAAPQPPSAPTPAPTGGANTQPMIPPLPGLTQPQSMMAYFTDPSGYFDKLAAAHSPTDFAKLLEQSGVDPNSALGRQIMQAQVAKQNYTPPISGRPGGWTIYPDGHREYNPTAPAPGAMPVMDGSGQPTGKWTEDPSVASIQASQAGAVAGAQAGAKAPYDTIQVYNPNTGQLEVHSKADVTGGGSLNSYYGRGGGTGGHPLPAGPSLGQQSAFDAYGKGSAQAFLETQAISKESPQRVQALREMQGLLKDGLSTGPTASKFQQLAEEHGLPFGYSNNAFVFNKDAARFVAQSASDLGLNGSDARLGMMAHASPNMTMTPQALKVVIPTMIGLEYAKMAKATAAANYAQHNPAGNAQFESSWRQAYDPRMFTAYAEGGPAALAKAPANLRQQWLKDYRTLKGMGVDFGQFAQ